MTSVELIILVLLFLVTSVFGVVTGSNSLITVPVMFQFGIDEKRAIATNMFGLTFMAIGGTIPFLRQGKIDAKKLSPLIVVTIVGSALGALLVGYITNQSIKVIVSVAMIVVVVFTLFRPKADGSGLDSDSPPYEGGDRPPSGGQGWFSRRRSVEAIVGKRENHPVGETPPALLRKEGSFFSASP